MLSASRMDLSLSEDEGLGGLPGLLARGLGSAKMRSLSVSSGSWHPEPLSGGTRQRHTCRATPVLGKPPGCRISGSWWPQQSCCGSQSGGCPAVQGSQFASGCLGMLQCGHLWTWYRDSSGLSGAPPIVDGNPESWTGLYCGSHPDPAGLAKLKAVDS